MRELILTIVNYASSSTATQNAAVLGASVLAVRPRVPELSRSELIEQTAERGETKSGMYARCCRAVVTSRGGA